MIAAGLSLLAVAAPASSPAADPSYLLIQVEYPPEFVGQPQSCDGGAGDRDMICFSELDDTKVVVLRHLGGPKLNYRVRVRSSGHHQYPYWARGTRLLVRTVPFEDKGVTGHFATYWQSEKDGKFCLEPAEIATFGNTPLARLFARGRRTTVGRRNAYWSRGTKLLCVRGDEPLASQ